MEGKKVAEATAQKRMKTRDVDWAIRRITDRGTIDLLRRELALGARQKFWWVWSGFRGISRGRANAADPFRLEWRRGPPLRVKMGWECDVVRIAITEGRGDQMRMNDTLISTRESRGVRRQRSREAGLRDAGHGTVLVLRCTIHQNLGDVYGKRQ